MLVTFHGAEGMTDALAPVPSYRFPESAAHALARAANFRDWLATPSGDIPVLDGINNAAARAVIASASVSPAGWLSPCDAGALLEACAIPRARVTCVTSEDAAVAVATRVGYPVVLKAAGAAILHKTEAHAVRTDLRDAAAVRTAYREFASRMGKDVEQILVQPRVPDGVEFLVGVTFDPTFGHVLVCGLGGTLVDVLRDTSCRLHPLTDRDAADMIDGLRGAVLLRGFRGTPARKESALRDVLLRVSALVELCPEIVELDINPVIVTTTAATAVDVRIRIQR